MKWIGIGLGGLVGLAIVAGVALYLIGSQKLNQKYEVPVESVTVPGGAQAVQRGEHLATILICTRCHNPDLSGQVYFDVPGMLSVPTPNLTRGKGGVGAAYTDADWVRAIRHGVGQDGRGLMLMTSAAYQHLSGEDLGSLIAYLKSVPPVDNVLPARSVEPVGRLMMAAGISAQFRRADQPQPGPARRAQPGGCGGVQPVFIIHLPRVPRGGAERHALWPARAGSAVSQPDAGG